MAQLRDDDFIIREYLNLSRFPGPLKFRFKKYVHTCLYVATAEPRYLTMKFIPFTTIAATVITAATIAPVSRGGNPTFYIIRHAEKDSDGDISAKGKEREKCLIKVFGRDSNYDIQYIMAPKRHEGGRLHLHIPGP